MIVAGIGCRGGVAASAIVTALEQACTEAALERNRITALATGFRKAEEPGLREAAVRLHLPLIVCAADELTSVESRLLTFSEKSLTVTGYGSLSEAAALAAAGTDSRLLFPRFIVAGVTIAFATPSGDNS